MKRALLLLLVACHAPEEPARQQPLPVISASDAVAPVAPMRAHASGSAGTVTIDACPHGLAIRVTPPTGAPWRVWLEGVDPSTPDGDVRLVDVDHDGLPDPIVAAHGDGGAPLVVARVFLTTQAGSNPNPKDCELALPVDYGSEGFMLGARTLDDAAAALAAVPRETVTTEQGCVWAAASPAARVPTYEYQYGELEKRTKSLASLRLCDQKVRDGSGFLQPSWRCDSFRPYWSFGLASGDTVVPPTEMRLWFDVASKRVSVAAAPSL